MSHKRLKGFPAPTPVNRNRLAAALMVSSAKLHFVQADEVISLSPCTTWPQQYYCTAVLGSVTACENGCQASRSRYDKGVVIVRGKVEASHAQFAAQIYQGKTSSGRFITQLDRLYIWPNCDVPRLAAFLVSMKRQCIASTDYSAGLIDIDAARKWIQKEFGIDADEFDDCLFIDNYPVYLDSLSDTGFPGVDEYYRRHGMRLFHPFLGPRQKSYLAAMGNCKKAFRHVRRYYRVVAYSQGSKKLMKFGHKGESELTPFNSLYLSQDEPMHCLQMLLVKHFSLWDMLWKAARERKELAPAYPTYSELRFHNGYWEARRNLANPFERIGQESDYVVINSSAPEFRNLLSCLSGKQKGKTPRVPTRLIAALCSGDMALVSANEILIPIKIGEMKGLTLHFGYAPYQKQDSSVWCCCLIRQPTGIKFIPIEAGTMYHCVLEEVYYR